MIKYLVYRPQFASDIRIKGAFVFLLLFILLDPGSVLCEMFLHSVERTQTLCTGKDSLRTQMYFRLSRFSPPKNNVCVPERQNDFRDVAAFVFSLANQIT